MLCDWDARDVAAASMRAALARLDAARRLTDRQWCTSYAAAAAMPSTPMQQQGDAIVLVDVAIPNGTSGTIECRPGDSPTRLANDFAKLNSLTPKQTKKLREAIVQATQGISH